MNFTSSRTINMQLVKKKYHPKILLYYTFLQCAMTANTLEPADKCWWYDGEEFSQHFMSCGNDSRQTLGRGTAHFPAHIIIITVFIIRFPEHSNTLPFTIHLQCYSSHSNTLPFTIHLQCYSSHSKHRQGTSHSMSAQLLGRTRSPSPISVLLTMLPILLIRSLS